MTIGIGGVRVELADSGISSAEFARYSGIPQEVVERKLGFKTLRRWGEGPGAEAGCLTACRRALGDLDPARLGAIITVVHPQHGEFDAYGYVNTLRDKLGAENAEVFDIADTCASVLLALQMARELLLAEPELECVLIAGILQMADAIDMSNPTTTWMANLSDGAGAMLVSRDAQLDNVLLETAHLSDPQFIDDVVYTSPYETRIATYRERYRRLLPRSFHVVDKDGMKNRLDRVSLPNYVKAIQQSLERSGFRPDEVDLIGANTMKPSMWQAMLDPFKLEPRSQMYLDDVGHMGYLDQMLYVQRVRERRRLPGGGVLVLTTAGVGFHWLATTVAFKGPRLAGRLA